MRFAAAAVVAGRCRFSAARKESYKENENRNARVKYLLTLASFNAKIYTYASRSDAQCGHLTASLWISDLQYIDLGRDLRLWLRSRTVQPVHTLSPFFPYRHLLFRTAVLCEEVVDTVGRIEQVTDRAIVI